MNEKYKSYIIIAVAVIVLFSLFGGLYYNGSRVDEIREQLDTVRANQRQLSEEIQSAGTTNQELANDIAGGRNQINLIDQTNRSIKADISKSGSIIADSKQVIRAVRERATEKAE